jgi:hypothetical protein
MSAIRRDRPRPASKDALARDYEPSDMPPRAIIYSLAALFLGIGVSAALIAGLLALFAETREPQPETAIEMREIIPPQPRLQVSPSADLAAMEADTHRRLDGYGWSDRKAGLAHIPISAAMQMIARHGWPDSPDQPAPAAHAMGGSPP